jgi:hypothetical protein
MSFEAALKPIAIEGENGGSSDNLNKELKRRAALEAQLTAGCGYGRKKQELVDTFWNTVWLELEKAGWSKVGLLAKTIGILDVNLCRLGWQSICNHKTVWKVL